MIIVIGMPDVVAITAQFSYIQDWVSDHELCYACVTFMQL